MLEVVAAVKLNTNFIPTLKACTVGARVPAGVSVCTQQVKRFTAPYVSQAGELDRVWPPDGVDGVATGARGVPPSTAL